MTRDQATAGRKRMALWDRIVPKIEVTGDPLLSQEIPGLVNVPPEHWPQPFKEPWLWTGYHKTGKPEARLLVEKRSLSVPRMLYELMIGVIPPSFQLRNTDSPLNVNPLYWKLVKIHDPNIYAFTPEDFEEPVLPSEIADEFEELAQHIHESGLTDKRLILAEFELMLFGLIPEDVDTILEKVDDLRRDG